MKKRVAISIVSAILVCVVILGVALFTSNPKPTMEGYFVRGRDNQYLIINDKGNPIVMSNQSKQDTIFDDLQTGYRIVISYDEILETSPARTGVYRCKLLKKGTIADIPESALKQLQEQGWIPADQP